MEKWRIKIYFFANFDNAILFAMCQLVVVGYFRFAKLKNFQSSTALKIFRRPERALGPPDTPTKIVLLHRRLLHASNGTRAHWSGQTALSTTVHLHLTKKPKLRPIKNGWVPGCGTRFPC